MIHVGTISIGSESLPLPLRSSSFTMPLLVFNLGPDIAFIQSEQSLVWLWIPMELVNIWRIPLLFFVSGMGVCFAMRKRDWRGLLEERLKRILLPLVFGALVIVSMHFLVF